MFHVTQPLSAYQCLSVHTNSHQGVNITSELSKQHNQNKPHIMSEHKSQRENTQKVLSYHVWPSTNRTYLLVFNRFFVDCLQARMGIQGSWCFVTLQSQGSQDGMQKLQNTPRGWGMQSCAVQFCAVQSCANQFSVVQCCVVLCRAVHSCGVLLSAELCNVLHRCAVQCSVVQFWSAELWSPEWAGELPVPDLPNPNLSRNVSC